MSSLRSDDDVVEYLAPLLDGLRDPEAAAEFQAYVKDLYESGDQSALLEMIYWCAQMRWPLPEWAAKGFVLGYGKVKRAEVGSLDEAFGRPHPKGAHISKALEANMSRRKVFVRVRELHEQHGVPIDDGMFERVGEEFGYGKTWCSDRYYEFDRFDKPLREAGLSIFRQLPKVGGNT